MFFPGNSIRANAKPASVARATVKDHHTHRDDEAGEHVAGEVAPAPGLDEVAEVDRRRDPEPALRVVGRRDRRQHHSDERDDRDHAEDDQDQRS